MYNLKIAIKRFISLTKLVEIWKPPPEKQWNSHGTRDPLSLTKPFQVYFAAFPHELAITQVVRQFPYTHVHFEKTIPESGLLHIIHWIVVAS